MPLIGYGTFLAKDVVPEAINAALEAGVRLFDCAFMYNNETEIGSVLKKWLDSGRIKRADLTIVSKLPMFGMSEADVAIYLDKTLKALQLDYVDLYLIHHPVAARPDDDAVNCKYHVGAKFDYFDADLLEVWRGMEQAVESGKAKTIGVSNFSSEQCERIMSVAKVPIAANQVELHAYFQQRKLRETLDKLGIKLMAFAPMGSRRHLARVEEPFPLAMDNPTVASIAKAHGKSAAQVLLRHAIQQEIIVVSMSTNYARIKQNYDILDFALNEEEMSKMNALDKGSSGRTFDFEYLPSKTKYADHKECPFIERDRY